MSTLRCRCRQRPGRHRQERPLDAVCASPCRRHHGAHRLPSRRLRVRRSSLLLPLSSRRSPGATRCPLQRPLASQQAIPEDSSSPRPSHLPRRSADVQPRHRDASCIIPEIVVGFDEEAVANAGIAALAACSELFTRGSPLIKRWSRPDLGPTVSGATPALQSSTCPRPASANSSAAAPGGLVPRSDDPAESALSHVPSWAVSGIAARRESPQARPLPLRWLRPPFCGRMGRSWNRPAAIHDQPVHLTRTRPIRASRRRAAQADARAAAECAPRVGAPHPLRHARRSRGVAGDGPARRPPASPSAPRPRLCIIEDGAKSWWAGGVMADLAVVVGAAPLAVVDVDDLLPVPAGVPSTPCARPGSPWRSHRRRRPWAGVGSTKRCCARERRSGRVVRRGTPIDARRGADEAGAHRTLRGRGEGAPGEPRGAG